MPGRDRCQTLPTLRSRNVERRVQGVQRRPCADCPFRSDKPFHLEAGRTEEIADSLRAGTEFSCHKTVDYGQDAWEDGRYFPRGGEQFCAGTLEVMENSEGPNQMMRIAEGLGMYDPSKLDPYSLVHADLDEFVDSMAGNP